MHKQSVFAVMIFMWCWNISVRGPSHIITVHTWAKHLGKTFDTIWSIRYIPRLNTLFYWSVQKIQSYDWWEYRVVYSCSMAASSSHRRTPNFSQALSVERAVPVLFQIVILCLILSVIHFTWTLLSLVRELSFGVLQA